MDDIAATIESTEGLHENLSQLFVFVNNTALFLENLVHTSAKSSINELPDKASKPNLT